MENIATALINNCGQIQFNISKKFKMKNLKADIILIGEIQTSAYSRLPPSYPSNRDILIQVSIEDLENTKKVKISLNTNGDADLFSIDFWQTGEYRGTGNDLSLGVITGMNRTLVMTTEQYIKLIDFLKK